MTAYLKGLSLSFLAIIISLGATFYGHKEGFFDLEVLDFSIQDLALFEDSEIIKDYNASIQADLNKQIGLSLLSISVRGLHKNILNNDWVKEVKIRRSFPNQLKVNIIPKTWLAYIFEDNNFYPMVNNGSILSPVPILKSPSLPIIHIKRNEMNEYKKNYLANIFKALPSEGLISHKSLKEIGSDREGLYLVIQPSATIIRLGDDHLDLRLARVEKVLSYLQERELQSRVINANFTQKVVVKLRKAR